jgi:hypothetical protein
MNAQRASWTSSFCAAGFVLMALGEIAEALAAFGLAFVYLTVFTALIRRYQT